MAEPLVLHPEIFDQTFYGSQMMAALDSSARQSAAEVGEIQEAHPDISLVLRTRNNAAELGHFFEDLDRQQSNHGFTGGIELIIADTESTDGSVAIARALGQNASYDIEVVPIQRRGFNYPRGLNRAFEAASNQLIFSTVGHALFSNSRTFDAAIRANVLRNFGGAFGPAVPNSNASFSEQLGAVSLGILKGLRSRQLVAKPALGVLASDRALINKEAWEALDKYDERYGAGGEDGALAKRMLDAGLRVVRDPVLTMHHTHGLSPIRTALQLAEWTRLSRPHPFSPLMHRILRPDQHKP